MTVGIPTFAQGEINMMNEQVELHGCGGQLFPTVVMLSQKRGHLIFSFPVSGLRCSKCGETVFSRDTAASLEELLQLSVETFEGKIYIQSMPTVVLDSPNSTTSVPNVSPSVVTTNEVVVFTWPTL
jgi:hypothetical protein